jgi:monolysocardiolipin acyltransferase
LCAPSQVSGAAQLEQAVLARAPGQGLLTVCNHVGALDDPLVLAAALPPALLARPSALRWTLCATDRCFFHPLVDSFFRAGKVLPLARGAGLEQPGLAAAEARLARGDWVHIFPEGTRSQTGAMGPVRAGVGRLYAAALAEALRRAPDAPPPLILPFVHAGMERVNPRGTALLSTGNEVHVLVGQPLDLSPLVAGAFTHVFTLERGLARR